MGSDNIGLGAERVVHFSDVEAVRADGQVVFVQGVSGIPLVDLHVNTNDDAHMWVSGIQFFSQGSDDSSQSEDADQEDQESDEVMRSLYCRSNVLQREITDLESVTERRDKQIQKMIGRLDGAMQMLTAVQEMCSQQQKVIYAQQRAIGCLKREGGFEDADLAGNAALTNPCGESDSGSEEDSTADGSDQKDSQQTTSDRLSAEMSKQTAQKIEKMLAALKEVDEMQQALKRAQAEDASVAAPASIELPVCTTSDEDEDSHSAQGINSLREKDH